MYAGMWVYLMPLCTTKKYTNYYVIQFNVKINKTKIGYNYYVSYVNRNSDKNHSISHIPETLINLDHFLS